MIGSDRMQIKSFLLCNCYPWCYDYDTRYCRMWYENRIRRRGNVQGYAVADS